MADAAVSPDEIREYLRTRRKQFARKKNLTEELGQTRSDFVDGSGLNKTAVGISERLDRFSPEVRADVLRSLDIIREGMSGVWAQESTAEMDFDTPEPEKSGLAAGQQFERERKRKPGRPKKVKAEEAGPPTIEPTPQGPPDAAAAGAGEIVDEDPLGVGGNPDRDPLPWEQE